MKLPKTINIQGLPLPNNGRLNPDETYTFWFGYPAHIPNNNKVFLQIPEIPHRGAEGRPRHPEQAHWVDNVIQREGLRVTAVWYAHWRFENQQALNRFIELLLPKE